MLKKITATVFLLLSINASARIYTFEDRCENFGGTFTQGETISSFSYVPGDDGIVAMITTIPKDTTIMTERLFFINDHDLHMIAKDAYYKSDFVDICFVMTSTGFIPTAMFINLPQQ